MTNKNPPLNFVLVHGIFLGGWCWQRVATELRARGHYVGTPTQTGLGERSHLLSRTITLNTFVEDLCKHLIFEDLENVVLAGHSFGGAAITGAADRVPERLARLVYLDGAILQNGETWFDLLPPDLVNARKQAAQESSGGLSVPTCSATLFGASRRDDIDWLERRMTPHPLATFDTPLTLQNPVGNGLPTDYVACTDPVYEPTQVGLNRARAMDWPVTELKTSHAGILTEASLTADLLEKISR